MRASSSLTSIPQTLTPEAASVLNASIADASRRCHSYTTPLHIAAALLASPSGFLRQACIASHPNSSHPLRCRALDLCFSVALERLPTVASPDSPPPPPLSNALCAALKRAQAHQRKGSPEQQQLPLLAVKVELEHLIVSILDDPSVSRVMKEARFSSLAIKSAVENSLQVTSPARSPYLNPRLHNRNPNSGNLQSVSPATFPRIGTNGVVGSSSELFSPLRSTLPETQQKLTLCSQCMHNYKQEEINDQDPLLKRKTEELMKKWSDKCSLLHPSFHQKSNPTQLSLYANPKLVARKHSQTKTLGDDDLRLSIDTLRAHPIDSLNTSPVSPVMTDLILGQTKTTQNDRVKDFKKLVKGLIEKVWWQVDAAPAVATAVTRCKLRNGGAKGDTWLLFSGPDRTGKKKMVSALSELIFGTAPVIISLGLRRDSEEFVRGKTVLDRIAEGIKRNPFSVVMLQDIDEADSWVCGSIKCAVERGRFTDSYGREISVGNVVFVLTVNKQPLQDQLDEEKVLSMASCAWELKLSVENQKGRKRCRLSFDLNDVADVEEERLDSSDLTIEHDHDNTSSSGVQLLDLVDECIVFKKVDFGVIRRNIEGDITARFRAVFGDKMSVRVESEVVDRVLGGALTGSDNGLDSWAEKVLAPTIHRLKLRLFDLPIVSLEGGLVARLELDEKSEEDRSNEGDWMKSRIKVWVLGEEMSHS